ncbi:transposase [Nocardia sp. CDC159]|uniref:Transposase n=1 Tax=Nocardia pulmonis TaxID=2951408 RepID=A0A9X2ED35_9NOCA|nr:MULTISPECIES: transposase [Nocardia]MCM6778692.1 transposase [Nocardia pulmonis]MCM6791581.1 transposase [Nocardia sp. CDC159]
MLFSSFPRKDQRTRATQYLQGLLESPGRKSVRNIARAFGGSASGQGLHHFISVYDWDWMPMRRALAGYVLRTQQIDAWVVDSMVIRKAGRHSVGVERRFMPSEGRVLNVQQATALWAVSAETTNPLDWRMHLPHTWLDDEYRRASAAIPAELRPQPVEDLIVELCLHAKTEWQLPVRPLVLDARNLDVVAMVPRLRAAGIPVLARVGEATKLYVAEKSLSGQHSQRSVAASEIAPTSGRGRRVSLRPNGIVPAVGFPARAHAGGRGSELSLVELPVAADPRARALWLTDLPTARTGEVIRAATASAQVERDCAVVSDQVGARDYSGRTYGGWHRHMTLASAAHTLMMRAMADRAKAAAPKAG